MEVLSIYLAVLSTIISVVTFFLAIRKKEHGTFIVDFDHKEDEPMKRPLYLSLIKGDVFNIRFECSVENVVIVFKNIEKPLFIPGVEGQKVFFLSSLKEEAFIEMRVGKSPVEVKVTYEDRFGNKYNQVVTRDTKTSITNRSHINKLNFNWSN